MEFKLKGYQKRVLEALEAFLNAASDGNLPGAYAEIANRKDDDGQPLNPYSARAYRPIVEGLEGRPHVCMRVPTAGGKTYMAALSLPMLAGYRQDQLSQLGIIDLSVPVVLWLVPSDSIRQQTVAMFQDRSHPCSKAIRNEFGEDIRIFDIDKFDTLLPQDFFGGGCIIVSTAQMFRVGKRTKASPDGMPKPTRRIYAHNEHFAPHFNQILPDSPPRELDYDENGKPKHSLVNLLHLLQPIVVCDEAHNFISVLSKEVLRRINPSCVLEWTATPRQGEATFDNPSGFKHNVLASVVAGELKDEQMIKMPVRVGEHSGWEQAVGASVAERKRLAKIAADSGDRVRPIVLYRATNKNGEVPPQKLKEYLMDKHKIDADEIAIATGDTKELDGVDLLAEDCRIKHIITIEALREGWDCSYVYVLCTVVNARSTTVAEQLVGRMMRMPFAKLRSHSDLNIAYAHMPVEHSTAAVEALRNNMALEMGFEESEVEEIVQPILGSDDFWATDDKPLTIQVVAKPDFSSLSSDAQESLKANLVEVKPLEGENKMEVVVHAQIPKELKDAIIEQVPEQEKKEQRERLDREVQRLAVAKSPARRGEKFAALPQMTFPSAAEAGEEIVSNDSLYERVDWNDLGDDLVLRGFVVEDKGGGNFEIKLANDGRKLTYNQTDERQGAMQVSGPADDRRQELTAWLERQIHDPRYKSATLKRLIEDNLAYQLDTKHRGIDKLIQSKHRFAAELKRWLGEHQTTVDAKSVQRELFDSERVGVIFNYELPEIHAYPVDDRRYVAKSFVFKKHYYEVIGDLGNTGEEFEFAKVIDNSEHVKHWVRNIANKRKSYKLPISSSSNFYPDFIVELTNGKVLIVEYKGHHLTSDPETKRKVAVGQKMELVSGGRAYFLMVTAPKGSLSAKVNAMSQDLEAKIAEILAL